MDEQEQEELIQEDWEKEKNRILQKHQDFVETFGSARGIKALGHLSKFCLEHDCTFVIGDAHKGSYNQGVRRVILEIRHWLDMDMAKLEKEQTCQNQD